MDIDFDVSTAYCSSSKISSTATRFVTGVKTFEHITPALVELHWLPVPYRIVFKLLLVVYKVINGLCSALLCSRLADLLHHPKSSRNLRSNSRDLLMQPKSRTKTCEDRAVSRVRLKDLELSSFKYTSFQLCFIVSEES